MRARLLFVIFTCVCALDAWLASSRLLGADAAPSIVITSPANGSIIGPVDFSFTVSVNSPTGALRSVDYFADGILIGGSTNAPFSFTWNDPPHGYARVVARLSTASFGGVFSDPVHLTIGHVPPPPPKLARGPYLQSGSSTSMVVRWRTDWFVASVLRYGTNAASLDHALTNATASIDHEMIPTGLEADQRYFYSVGSATQMFAGGNDFYFRTTPATNRAVRMWVIGDSGTSDVYQQEVRDSYYAATGAAETDLLLMLGDNAYEDGRDHEYQKAVFNVYDDVLRHTPVWPTLGNHDAGDSPGIYGNQGRDYLQIFTLPANGESGGLPSGSELYYSFDYANIHVICLDSFLSGTSPDGPMLLWLQNDLVTTGKDWIIAFWHHPPYSKGTHDSDNEFFMSDMRERVLPILEAHGVDLVLCGHSHNYERSMLLDGHYGRSGTLRPGMILNAGFGRTNEDGAYLKRAGGMGARNGCVYTVCGCSGAGGMNEGFPLHPAMKLNRGGYGSMIITVDDLRLDAQFLWSSLDVGDHFTIDKSLDATNRPPLQISRGTNGVLLSWPTSRPAFTLQGTTALSGATNWQNLCEPVATYGRRNVVGLPANGEKRFFQLRTLP